MIDSVFYGFYDDDGYKIKVIDYQSQENKDLQAAIDEVNEIAPSPHLDIRMIL